MDAMTKSTLRGQISHIIAVNQGLRAQFATRGMPVTVNLPVAGPYGGLATGPVDIVPALSPYLQAFQQQSDNFDKMLKLLDDIVAKS